MMKTVTTNTIKALGRIRYSPTNNGKNIRRDGGTTNWWIIIECDTNIGRYYRHLYKMSTFGVQTLQSPTWDAHISVVCDEKPNDLSNWKKHDGKFIEYEYIHRPESNNLYVWLPVICERALDLREELGFRRRPHYPLHLTLGNKK